ncbi:hypothetical protein CfE428DRAFT_5273 [Chthoniobacter flavus Ellin428]|uniref:Glycosyltransferase-like protein n=1 Tax=Chthoniobacter flavus Ellin428 TaxID=497964 RepID=B4D8N3_9BACT|nr:hypothetical protein [Chthoniobacter flavus]EDY17255.1 hypothetical protein CfE428DRAFT_5273 [Chthoniobacter flavus Ellin428]TCO86922.1 hypothetical protein EV701_12517 [Chthoniobacter flavus]
MKYAFYPDAPPMQQGGHANHSTAWSWSQAMKDHIGLTITRRFHRRVDPEPIRQAIGMPIIFYPDFSRLGLRRFSDMLRCALDTLVFIFCLPWLASEIHRQGCTRIFAFPSGWWTCLLNAYLLGWATGLPVDVYVVDDIEALAVKDNKLLRARITRWAEQYFLPRFAKVYTLSKGHAELFQEKYGVTCEWLPLVIRSRTIEYTSPPKEGEIRYIGFSGSMNEYYAEALTELNRVVTHLNETTPHRYKIALCVITSNLPDIFPDPSVVELFVNLPNAQLVERLKLNYANYLPFSFSESLRILVSTSFSCKAAEYFAAGRPILVYGPAYSSTARHFLENNLPLVETTRGRLEGLIASVDAVDTPELIARYREVIQKYHSPEALRHQLLTFERPIAQDPSAPAQVH